MARTKQKTAGPRGGLRAGARSTRGWKWDDRQQLVTAPVRCRKEEWYLVRARLQPESRLRRATVTAIFLRNDLVIAQRTLRLLAPAGPDDPRDLLAWVQSPDDATHLQVAVPDKRIVPQIEELAFQDVSERDPKCHPLANVPRWDTVHQPPFPLERVVLPVELACLEDHFPEQTVEIAKSPTSAARLRSLCQHAACVLDPAWIRDLKLTWQDLVKLAGRSWLIIDLATTARLLADAGVVKTQLKQHESADGIFSARVEYGDVATRGTAMQDVVPYTIFNADGHFSCRTLKAGRPWQRFADREGIATLLSSETPWTDHHADVISAAYGQSGGELLMTDLPWVVAGRFGPLLTPTINAHLLRAHLGAPVPDTQQYWNRWDDGDTIVRDLGDLARRYQPLAAYRWATDDANVAHLGIAVEPAEEPPRVHVMFKTGRIDAVDPHDGFPPEPLAIYMKWLAREARENTRWARKHLSDKLVTWQFDTCDGLKYAANFDAPPPYAAKSPKITRLRLDLAGDPTDPNVFTYDEGLYGDHALQFQADLTKRLTRLIERA
jgi:hypothetical protein